MKVQIPEIGFEADWEETCQFGSTTTREKIIECIDELIKNGISTNNIALILVTKPTYCKPLRAITDEEE